MWMAHNGTAGFEACGLHTIATWHLKKRHQCHRSLTSEYHLPDVGTRMYLIVMNDFLQIFGIVRLLFANIGLGIGLCEGKTGCAYQVFFIMIKLFDCISS